uniref:Ig-like domain-containing protein n=1 Tax=Neogobius melanostomus TaxID=47308 RepID=A0A8C6TR98_9GOBI
FLCSYLRWDLSFLLVSTAIVNMNKKIMIKLFNCVIFFSFFRLCIWTDYEIKYTYNKTLFMEYNSTRGNWMGFTPLGVFWANIYNRDPWDPEQRKVEQLMLCSETIHVLKDSTSLLAAPSLKLTSVKQPSGTHPALLLCSAYNFYPQDIELTWFQNGQEVTSGVSSTEVLSDGDLYYQIHSYLEYSPKLGEEISCMVEHVSLSEPLVQAWGRSHFLYELLLIYFIYSGRNEAVGTVYGGAINYY